MGLFALYRSLQGHLLIVLLVLGYVKCYEFSEEEYVVNDNHFLKFTYSDEDTAYGPSKWEMIEDVQDTTNICYDNWRSPINVITELAAAHEKIRFVDETDELGRTKTLTLNIGDNSQDKNWILAYPADAFHGIVIRTPYNGMMQIFDLFDPLRDDGENTMYDLDYASIHYCDLKSHPNRSMHQIDGERFPLEIQMIFYKNEPKIGIDSTVNGNTVIMFSILGKLDPDNKDNPILEPLMVAAKRFVGVADFNLDLADYQKVRSSMVKIKGPWSLSWLIPDMSAYYYYNEGSFTVPPCFRISRVYISKTPILISKRQLDVLTHIKSAREPSGILACTFSVLQNDLDDIRFNSNDYEIRGSDGRPMTGEQTRRLNERNAKVARDQKRILMLKRGYVEESKGSTVRVNYKYFIIYQMTICLTLYVIMQIVVTI